MLKHYVSGRSVLTGFETVGTQFRLLVWFRDRGAADRVEPLQQSYELWQGQRLRS